MEIGTNEIDEFDDFNEEFNEDITTTQDIPENSDVQDLSVLDNEEEPSSDVDSEGDLIEELLKSKGIKDSSKIKFVNDTGDVEEVDWNSLNREDKLNILNSQDEVATIEDDLDDSEIQLLNAIRTSKMSPEEFIRHIQQQSVDYYIQNNQSVYQPQYEVDQMDDDLLYISDLIARVGEDNISQEEVQESLEKAKGNPELFQKQIAAIRNEYKQYETNNRNQQIQQEQAARVAEYNRFAEDVEKEIRGFKDMGGYELNMDEDEMEELYDFITGFDAAQVSIFGKVLNNPKNLVRMAWFALHGEEAFQDMTDYWTNELKTVKQMSYNKGLEDAKKAKSVRQPSLEIRNQKTTKSSSKRFDLDDIDY